MSQRSERGPPRVEHAWFDGATAETVGCTGPRDPQRVALRL